MTDNELDRRDELAFRLLRGDALTEYERGELISLNEMLEHSVPKPVPLPAEVLELMAKASRRR